MENKYNLKPFDKVLVRDSNEDTWQIDLFEIDKTDISEYEYKCLSSSWRQCIPFEGNEHLLGTTNIPEITDLKNGILFGVELKVGYVERIEIEDMASLLHSYMLRDENFVTAIETALNHYRKK